MAWYDYIPGGSMINSMLHPEEGYEEAAKRMREAWQQAQATQQPYNAAGQGQLDRLNQAENQLLDPSKLLADWMSKYEMSPYAQRSIENAKNAGLDAASSMGLMGSSPAIANIQNSASDIMNADRQQFLNDMMQKYMAGIGIGKDIYGIGAQTAGNLGQQGLHVGENLAAAGFGEKNAPGNLLKDLLAMGGKMFIANQLGGVGGLGAGAVNAARGVF